MSSRETERLYFQDAKIFSFQAELISQEAEGDHWMAVLNRSAFYPEGGGQPADKGRLNHIHVLHVREEEGEILHLLPEPLPRGPVLGQIDESWRLDFMQQHTGQHIISASLYKTGKYSTVSSHLGESYTSVEIDSEAIIPEHITAAEDLANSIINQNLPLKTHLLDPDEIAKISLRKPPPSLDKPGGVRQKLRVVEIQGFDACACGGTHLNSTGEVGLVKAVGSEKIRRRLRLNWKIGMRAYEDYRQKDKLLSELSRQLTCSSEEITKNVQNLKDRLQQQTRLAGLNEDRLAQMIAEGLAEQAERISGKLMILHQFRDESNSLVRKILARLLAEPMRIAALVNTTPAELQLLAGTSSGIEHNLQEIIPPLLPLIEGRGGGKGSRWQGTGQKPEGADLFLSELKRAFNLQ